jgi:hypothetical protein
VNLNLMAGAVIPAQVFGRQIVRNPSGGVIVNVLGAGSRQKRADYLCGGMGNAALGVLEIKLLTQLQSDTTPRSLVGQLGLPLFDVYQMLTRLAKEGILAPGGGARSIDAAAEDSSPVGVTESVREALEALDANDDKKSRTGEEFGGKAHAFDFAAREFGKNRVVPVGNGQGLLDLADGGFYLSLCGALGKSEPCGVLKRTGHRERFVH